MSDDELRGSIGELLALVVHDLRNPTATVSANVSFVKSVGRNDDEDVIEALDDVEIAVGDINRGLEHLAWVGRWVSGEPALEGMSGSVAVALEAGVQKAAAPAVKLVLPESPFTSLVATAPLTRLVEVLVRNALAHADPSSVQVAAREEPGAVIVEVSDAGRAVGHDLRGVVFTLRGQQLIKTRTDGRYSRTVGLLAARALADSIGASIEALGEDGAALFRVRIPAQPVG